MAAHGQQGRINLTEENMKNDTIAAIATAPGTGGISMIRLSGPEAEKQWSLH